MIIYCNKILNTFLVTLSFLIFDGIYIVLMIEYANNILLPLLILLTINLVGIPLISYLVIKSNSRIIAIYNGYFEYIAKNDKFKIKLSSIKDYSYMKSVDGFYTLGINLTSGQINEINLTKGVIKKVAKVSNKELKYIENSDIVTLKEDINERFQEFKKSIIENIDKIICGIIGVIISGLCILGYNLLDNIYLSISMCVICYIMTSIQIFLFYTDDFITRKTRLIISCGAPLLFELIFLLVCWLLFKEIFLFIDILLYSIYILPAFVVVFIIILIIICGLGYM